MIRFPAESSNNGLRSDSAGPKVCIGIDNGFSGAVACLHPGGNVLASPVAVIDLGKERLLDLDQNRALLRQFIAAAAVPAQSILAVYEQCQPNPKFGSCNNFTNGKNGEFWRLLLSLEGIPFRCVNPQQWQKWIFRGIRGDDTKAMAALVCQQRFPRLRLEGYNRKQREGIQDATCIALWASELSAWMAQTGPSTETPSQSEGVTHIEAPVAAAIPEQ